MTRVVHGIVHGKTIEIIEDLGMSDGQAVELIVTTAPPTASFIESMVSSRSPKTLPGPPPGWRPGGTVTAAGMLSGEWTEEDDRILEQIEANRKAATWRELPE